MFETHIHELAKWELRDHFMIGHNSILNAIEPDSMKFVLWNICYHKPKNISIYI